MRIEVIPLIMNVGICLFYTWKRDEPGKILYWLGAVFIQIGLFKMRG